LRYASGLLLVALFALTAVQVSAEPQVWFAALDPVLRPEVGYGGSPQYMELFSPRAPWERAASHVGVIKVYGQWIDHASDADLQRQFADLKRRGIALALEFGAMSAERCGMGVEGYGGQGILEAARRIQRNGGVLSYLAMDEPLYFGSIYDGKNACHWTPEQAAASAVPNLKALRTLFPQVKIGDIEPVGEPTLEITSDRYRRGIRAFHALGVPLAFFHADVSWWTPSYPEKLSALHKLVASEHIAFGVIYNGNAEDPSDAAWLQSAESHMADVERILGTPEQVIFQSWNSYPKKLLPESAPDAFTHLIDLYFRTRTKLTSAVSRQEFSGRLTTALENPKPVAGAKIVLQLTSLSPTGTMGTLVAKGAIPPETTGMLFAIRVNAECGCSGPADLQVAELRLQPQGGPPIVSAFQNPATATSWSPTDTKGAHIGGVQNGLLQLAVRRGQQVMMNSPQAPVHTRGNFTFSVKAKVTPASTQSGYFAVIFMRGGQEASRTQILFRPATLTLGAATTRPDGSWSIRLPEVGDAFTAQAQYGGDEQYWPAQSSTTER
jgi:hypothetical protein